MRDFAKVDAVGRQETTDQAVTPVIHSTFDDAMRFIQERFPGGAYLFVGHGSSGQFKDTEKALENLAKITSAISARSKGKKWVAVYGGDDSNPEKPDIGFLMQKLKVLHKVPLMAIQAEKVLTDWGGVGKHIDSVFYYPTDSVEITDSDGKKKQKVLWGGIENGRPVGATKYYLSTDLTTPPSLLKGMIVFGGGTIAADEVSLALESGVQVTYYRSEIKNQSNETGRYGIVDNLLKPLCDAARKSKNNNSLTCAE